MQPKNKGFFRKLARWSMAGATGLALLRGGQTMHAQELQRPKAPTGLRIISVRDDINPTTKTNLANPINAQRPKAPTGLRIISVRDDISTNSVHFNTAQANPNFGSQNKKRRKIIRNK